MCTNSPNYEEKQVIDASCTSANGRQEGLFEALLVDAGKDHMSKNPQSIKRCLVYFTVRRFKTLIWISIAWPHDKPASITAIFEVSFQFLCYFAGSKWKKWCCNITALWCHIGSVPRG